MEAVGDTEAHELYFNALKIDVLGPFLKSYHIFETATTYIYIVARTAGCKMTGIEVVQLTSWSDILGYFTISRVAKEW